MTMSTNSVDSTAPHTQELDALMKDVQGLLHAFNAVKTENDQLKARLAQQDQLMEKAHMRLMSILKRLPNA